ncbi:hypothetical protein CRG98_027868 [Punica granatum]|uniref:Uncharacterized protein n=1 Tax=Punica granatum TaxID=22663 RepID=A0A2I0J637_PUNGR|nr:hypothetical protein CRG98_027868 [Punica granatum]
MAVSAAASSSSSYSNSSRFTAVCSFVLVVILNFLPLIFARKSGIVHGSFPAPSHGPTTVFGSVFDSTSAVCAQDDFVIVFFLLRVLPSKMPKPPCHHDCSVITTWPISYWWSHQIINMAFPACGLGLQPQVILSMAWGLA